MDIIDSYSTSERGASARPRFYRGGAKIDRDKKAVLRLPIPRLSLRTLSGRKGSPCLASRHLSLPYRALLPPQEPTGHNSSRGCPLLGHVVQCGLRPAAISAEAFPNERRPDNHHGNGSRRWGHRRYSGIVHSPCPAVFANWELELTTDLSFFFEPVLFQLPINRRLADLEYFRGARSPPAISSASRMLAFPVPAEREFPGCLSDAPSNKARWTEGRAPGFRGLNSRPALVGSSSRAPAHCRANR